MMLVVFILLLSSIEIFGDTKDECLSKKKVGAMIGNILRKRKYLTITLNPDELEYLASLKHDCAEADIKQKPIYFLAALKGTQYTTKAANEVMKFQDVIANEGGAYNSTNGHFVVPRTGPYLISFGFLSNQARGIHFHLEIQGKLSVLSYTPKDEQYNSAERCIPYPLKKGDVVRVRVSEAGASIYGNRYTTFSAMYMKG